MGESTLGFVAYLATAVLVCIVVYIWIRLELLKARRPLSPRNENKDGSNL
jgi:hypothetical protein